MPLQGVRRVTVINGQGQDPDLASMAFGTCCATCWGRGRGVKPPQALVNKRNDEGRW